MKAQNHVDTPKQLTHISLCAGYGGIDLGLHRVYGERLRTIAFSEIEAFAVENLVSKMEAGLFPPAPLWTDLRTFPWADFEGVDILSGGFPCQPFSAAGKRNADTDPRHLFPAIVAGIRHAKPRLVFLENVEGIVSAKLAGDGWRDPAGTPVLLHVLRELERVGYRAAWGIFSASEVGAWHERRRVYLLAAHAENRRIQRSWPDGKQSMGSLDWPPLFDALSSLPSPCLEVHRVRFAAECIDLDGSGEEPECPECKTDFADCACVGPSMDDDFDYQEDSAGQLTAHSKSEIHGGNDGLADWMDRMRLLGNGVVPATAERAFRTLFFELCQND